MKCAVYMIKWIFQDSINLKLTFVWIISKTVARTLPRTYWINWFGIYSGSPILPFQTSLRCKIPLVVNPTTSPEPQSFQTLVPGFMALEALTALARTEAPQPFHSVCVLWNSVLHFSPTIRMLHALHETYTTKMLCCRQEIPALRCGTEEHQWPPEWTGGVEHREWRWRF